MEPAHQIANLPSFAARPELLGRLGFALCGTGVLDRVLLTALQTDSPAILSGLLGMVAQERRDLGVAILDLADSVANHSSLIAD